MTKRCDACTHAASEQISDTPVWHCRRFPPLPMMVGEKLHSNFPFVRADWKCGEFAASVSPAKRKAKAS